MDRKTYTFDEAFKASLDYFTGDELAAKVWVNKYALKDAFGNIYEESPNDMHHRLASEIARVEKKYPNPLSEQELFDLFDHFRYIVPQGSPMTGIGNDYQIASIVLLSDWTGKRIRMVRLFVLTKNRYNL